MIRLELIVAMAVLLPVGPQASGAEAETPAGEHNRVEAVKISVVSVKGQCERLVADANAPIWASLVEGEELGQLAIIRTGLRSEVVLQFDRQAKVTIRSSTKMGISEFYKDGKTFRTQLGLSRGSIHVSVDSSRAPNDFRVQTPVALLSVTGTSGEIGYTADAGVQLRGETGTWRVMAAGRKRNVKAGETTDDKLTPSIEREKTKRQVLIGDAYGGLSEADKRELRYNGDGRGALRFSGGVDLRSTVGGGAPSHRNEIVIGRQQAN